MEGQAENSHHVPNPYKWPETKLLIPQLEENLNIINEPIIVWEKLDGTNVGIDENGYIYGRNFLINLNVEAYQGVSLAYVRQLAPKISELYHQHFLGKPFVLYGELMCNEDKYNYKDRLDKESLQMFCAFGLRFKNQLKPNDPIRKKFFTFDRGESTVIIMGQDLQKLLFDFGIQSVPYMGYFPCLDPLLDKYNDWMLQGNGEGMVVIFPKIGYYKFKIGAEKNFINKTILQKLQRRLSEILNTLENIQNSKLRMGEDETEKLKLHKAQQKEAKRKRKQTVEPDIKIAQTQMIESALSKLPLEPLSGSFIDRVLEEINSSGDGKHLPPISKNDVARTIKKYLQVKSL